MSLLPLHLMQFRMDSKVDTQPVWCIVRDRMPTYFTGMLLYTAAVKSQVSEGSSVWRWWTV